MKLSNDTLNILKNFSLINQSILFKPGNKLRTTNGSSVFAEADIEETFVVKAAIWDLPRFLSILSVVESPDIIFYDSYLKISSNTNTVKYAYASESLIQAPDDEAIVVKDTLAEFSLPWEHLDKILKAVNILRTDVISFEGDGSEVTLTTSTKAGMNGAGSDSFTIKLNAPTSNKFKINFKPENIKIIPTNYAVRIDTRRFVNIESDRVKYFIGAEVD